MARRDGPRTAPTPAVAALRRLAIEHRIHSYTSRPHAEAGYALEAAEALGIEPERVFKTLVCDLDDTPTVAIVPASGTADLKAVAAALGAKRARMLPVAQAERVTGYVAGGISPLGQRSRHPTVVDSSALAPATVFVSAGRRGLEIEMSGADLVRVTDAVVAAIALGG